MGKQASKKEGPDESLGKNKEMFRSDNSLVVVAMASSMDFLALCAYK